MERTLFKEAEEVTSEEVEETSEKEVRTEDRYIQFPLCLLQKTYENPINGLNIILSFGIVNYGMKMKIDLTAVARQLLYCYLRKRDVMQVRLVELLEYYMQDCEIYLDEDHYGFSTDGSEFNPTEEISRILELFKTDLEFKNHAILNYRIFLAAKFLNLSLGSIDTTINRYEEALKFKDYFENKHGGDVYPSIKPAQLIDFRDSGKDIDLFRVYVAIKSLIGRNSFATCNKPAILSRMLGCKSKSAFEFFVKSKSNRDKNLLPTYEKYSKRYRMDKLLLTLAERKFVMFLAKPKVSVLYVSKYMEPGQLLKLVQETRQKRDLKKQISMASKQLI